MKLDIGAGDYPRAGYLTVDAYNPKADVIAEMWDLPYGDGTVDAMNSSHSLEHISKHQVADTLQEWWRVLGSNRWLCLEVPNLLAVCQRFIDKPDDPFTLDMIFGLQTHDGEYHKTGFTEDSLRAALTDAGFTDVTITHVWSHEQDCLQALARKP